MDLDRVSSLNCLCVLHRGAGYAAVQVCAEGLERAAGRSHRGVFWPPTRIRKDLLSFTNARSTFAVAVGTTLTRQAAGGVDSGPVSRAIALG